MPAFSAATSAWMWLAIKYEVHMCTPALGQYLLWLRPVDIHTAFVILVHQNTMSFNRVLISNLWRVLYVYWCYDWFQSTMGPSQPWALVGCFPGPAQTIFSRKVHTVIFSEGILPNLMSVEYIFQMHECKYMYQHKSSMFCALKAHKNEFFLHFRGFRLMARLHRPLCAIVPSLS